MKSKAGGFPHSVEIEQESESSLPCENLLPVRSCSSCLPKPGRSPTTMIKFQHFLNLSRRGLVFAALVLFIESGGVPLPTFAKPPPPSKTVDVNALVRRMIATYHRLDTLVETSETKVGIVGIGEFLQSSALSYKRPGLIKLTTSDPSSGTYTIQSDGKSVVAYSAKKAIFVRRNAPSTLPDILAKLQQLSQDEIGITNAQILTPLSFLIADNFPTEAKTFRYVGLEIYNKSTGKKAHHLSAVASDRVLTMMTGTLQKKVVRRSLELWIDPQTNLVVRSRGDFAWYGTVKQNNQPPQQVFNAFTFDEMRKTTRTDLTLSDAGFRFEPPKGVTLKYQQRKN